MSIEKVLYRAQATSQGGREGTSKSSDGALDVTLSTPKELGGGGGAGTNPEQLFAAGYSACFDSALNMVARMQKVKHEGTQVTGTVSFGKAEDGGFALAVRLDVLVKGIDRDTASKLAEEAHNVCPYSRATRGNIAVEINVL